MKAVGYGREPCPNCGNKHETVFVWKKKKSYEKNKKPDYHGCMDCNEMQPYED